MKTKKTASEIQATKVLNAFVTLLKSTSQYEAHKDNIVIKRQGCKRLIITDKRYTDTFHHCGIIPMVQAFPVTLSCYVTTGKNGVLELHIFV